MSEIRKELMTAAGMTPKRGEAETDFLIRLQKAISEEIAEEVWVGLSVAAQDWNNDAADAIVAGKAIPDFPDAKKAEEPAAAPAATGRRRGGAETPQKAPAAYEAKLGDEVVVETKRGKKETGVIVDLTADEIVINAGGDQGAAEDDKVFERALVSVSPLDDGSTVAADSPAAEPETPEVGDTVTVVTARDKTITGNVIELSDETVVIKDASGEEHELGVNRLKSFAVKVKNSKAAPKPAAVASAGRGRSAAPAAESEKPKRSVNPPGVSVGNRIRELTCDNPKTTADDIAKVLKKEGLEFRPTTVGMIFKDTQAIFGMLRARKMLK